MVHCIVLVTFVFDFSINSSEEFRQWLKNNPNLYNHFILLRLEDPNYAPTEGEWHHIIPKHSNGPDEDWNTIFLTHKDHVEAHRLRAQVYNEPGDKLILNLFANPAMNTAEAKQERRARGHATQKRNKTGFSSSELQAKLGRKGGAKQTPKKVEKYKEKQNPIVTKTLEEGCRFRFKNTDIVVIIPPKTIELLWEVHALFMAGVPESEEKEKLANITVKVNFTSLLRKVLVGERKSFYGFYLEK